MFIDNFCFKRQIITEYLFDLVNQEPITSPQYSFLSINL